MLLQSVSIRQNRCQNVREEEEGTSIAACSVVEAYCTTTTSLVSRSHVVKNNLRNCESFPHRINQKSLYLLIIFVFYMRHHVCVSWLLRRRA